MKQLTTITIHKRKNGRFGYTATCPKSGDMIAKADGMIDTQELAAQLQRWLNTKYERQNRNR